MDEHGDGADQDPAKVLLDRKLKKLRKVRGGHRGYATLLIKTSEEFLVAPPSDKVTTDLKTNDLLLKDKLVEIKALDQEILELIEDEKEYEDELVKAGENNRKISRVIVETGEYLQANTKVTKSVDDNDQKVRIESSGKFNPVRLPRLDFPTFDGDPLKWKTFWDTFECIVENDKTIDDMMKFTYLRQKLEGKAKIALDGLTLTKANYREAVKLLKERFGDEQYIIQAHMDALLELEPTEKGDVASLRKLCDVVEVHIRNLQQFAIAVKNYGPVLISIVVNKLPQDVKLEVTRQMPEGKWEIGKLMEIVKKEVTARERCSQRNQYDGFEEESSASTLHVGGGKGGRGGRGGRRSNGNTRTAKKKVCVFCERTNHSSENCRTVSSIVQRKNMIRTKGRCFICLGVNHMARECNSKNSCPNCNGKHHLALCQSGTQEENSPGGDAQEVSGDGGDGTTCIVNDDKQLASEETSEHEGISNNIVSASQHYVLLQTAKTSIFGNDAKNKTTARLIFDNCSQRSYVRESIRKKLNLKKVGEKMVSIKAFGAEKGEVKLVDVVIVNVCTRENPGKSIEVRVFVVPFICLPVSNQFIDNTKDRYPVLAKIDLADDNKVSTNLEIDILIGANYLNKFVSTESIQVNSFLRAVRTSLGWVLNGSVGADRDEQSVNVTSVQTMHVQDEEMFRKFWEIEDCEPMEEQFNAEQFKKRIEFDGERYTVPLPFLPGMVDKLPTNYGLSLKRLSSTTQRLDREPDKLKRYDDVIRKQEAEGKIERVTGHPPQGKVHYLPHHPVEKLDRETTKTRLVYDGSSGKPSLNDCLDKGENLVPLLFDVLIRSRVYKVALVSDIREAFLNVGLQEEFRDFVRFLWYDDAHSPDREIIMFRFTRVLFGVNASLWLLVIAIRKHLEKYVDKDPNFVKYVLRCLFVDDNVGGADDSGEAFEMYKKLKQIFLEAGFDLRKWCSNDCELVQQIKACEAKQNNDGGETDVLSKKILKTLGVTWNVTEDEYSVPTHQLFSESRDFMITKRNILKAVASIFDPLGMISPVVITFKIFFQQLTQMKVMWDDKLSMELQIRWVRMLEMLEDDSLFHIRRYVFGSHMLRDLKNITLHGFCDASEVAYAAVIYTVGETGEGEKSTCFLTSKTKVAPVKKISTPRLELCSCLLLANLMMKVSQALDGVVRVADIVSWNDSVDALYWIKNEKKYRKVFVEHRVQKIRKAVPPQKWRYVPTDVNPADVASRGFQSRHGVRKGFQKWISGPEILSQLPLCWPVDLSRSNGVDPDEREVTTVICTHEVLYNVISLHVTDEITHKKAEKVGIVKRSDIDKVVDIERFGCLWKLLRVTAWVKRACAKFKQLMKNKRHQITDFNSFLSIQEIQDAENAWIVAVQRDVNQKTKQLNNTLGLHLETNGVLTCRGRLENAELTIRQKHPILIPGGSYFARLLVKDAHLRTAHGGPKDTLVELRSAYWVTKARSLVQQVLHRCPRPCRRLEGRSFKSVEASQLPSFRVQQSHPFSNTGVDYLGPALVRQVYDDGDLDMHKTWIVLYTCAVTRAVHLDLVPDSSASAFLRSLKRFIGRRGVPNLMVSDNATCFKNEEVRLNEELLRLRVKWQFIVAASPWWGGFWERLVQTVKRSLRKVLFRASVTYEELLTTIADVEGVINSRPLTYVYENDVEEVLTPSHLLLGRRLLSTFEEPFDDGAAVDNAVLTRRMKYLKSLSQHYWRRFREEYLLELRAHHTQGHDPNRRAEVGEVVVIEGTSKRNDWRLGKIVRFNPGADGRCRSAVIKTFDGSNSRYIQRPIERLYPIEVKSVLPVDEEEIGASDTLTSSSDEQLSSDVSERPRRVAAETGILMRRLAGN